MKINHLNVEYVTEYAKELTYEERLNILLKDQLYILAKQHRMIYRLRNKVEYIIMDSPLLLTLAFYNHNMIYNYDIFKKFVIDLYNKYPNESYYIKRNLNIPYSTDGRKETLKESIKMDKIIKKILDSNNIKYTNILADENTYNEIYKRI